jgi:hypothetical protein
VSSITPAQAPFAGLGLRVNNGALFLLRHRRSGSKICALLRLMHTNVYRKTVRANRCSARYCTDSLVTSFLLAVAALSLGTFLALLRWPF